MPPHPTASAGQNQTLLELIFALKGLAQTVEFYHKDLSQRLDEEAKARTRELEQLRVILGKNNQVLNVLPITISDRVEKLLDTLETEIDHKLEDVSGAVSEVRQKLWQYMKVTERAISQTESSGEVEPVVDEKADITGKIEVTKAGDVKMQFNSKLLKKMWYAMIVLAAGGGVYGIKEALSSLFGL